MADINVLSTENRKLQSCKTVLEKRLKVALKNTQTVKKQKTRLAAKLLRKGTKRGRYGSRKKWKDMSRRRQQQIQQQMIVDSQENLEFLGLYRFVASEVTTIGENGERKVLKLLSNDEKEFLKVGTGRTEQITMLI